MRKHLIVGVVALSLSTISTQAQARIVFDPSAFKQHLTKYVQEAAHWVSEIAWYKRQYEMLTSSYNALTSVTDLQSAAWAFGTLTRNFYPDANVVPDLMSDASQLWGTAGQWDSWNLYYQSRIMDKWAYEMQRRSGVTSNAQAMAEASSWNTQHHMSTLAILQGQLQRAVDITEVNRINGLIALNAQNLQVHQQNTQNVALLLEADDRVTRQREEQIRREGAERLWMKTAPMMGDLR